MSKSAVVPAVNFSAESIEEQAFELTAPVGSPAWKQEVNKRLAAHRTRREDLKVGPGDAADGQGAGDAGPNDGLRSASSRAAEAAARVAARYAKAPSYKQLLAGEARAVVKAAGAAAEAARNAQAAAQAVLTGLEFVPNPQDAWEPQAAHPAKAKTETARVEAAKNWIPDGHPAPSRWQDEPPTAQTPMTAAEIAWMEFEASQPGNQRGSPQGKQQGKQGAGQLGNQQGLQHLPKPRWEESLPAATAAPAAGVGRDEWSEMRLHPAPERTEQYGNGQYGNEESGTGRAGTGQARTGQAGDGLRYSVEQDERDVYGHDPIGDATVEPVQPIPANLIEFPRELVAARKARPRLAEGPYYDAAKESPQLSIFEVDPDLLAPPIYLSDTAMDVTPPEWASMQLEQPMRFVEVSPTVEERLSAAEGYADHASAEAALLHAVDEQSSLEPAPIVSTGYETHNLEREPMGCEAMPEKGRFRERVVSASDPNKAAAWESAVKNAAAQETVVASAAAAELFVAPLSDRLLAAVVDGGLVTLAFLAAAMVVLASTAHPPTGWIALFAAGCGLLMFGMIYQFLFFSYAEEGTPGMRYARIALCTFEDDNPSREQVRKRIPALLLSALPVGMGLAWAFIDGDGLAMHDRLTKTYQRKY